MGYWTYFGFVAIAVGVIFLILYMHYNPPSDD